MRRTMIPIAIALLVLSATSCFGLFRLPQVHPATAPGPSLAVICVLTPVGGHMAAGSLGSVFTQPRELTSEESAQLRIECETTLLRILEAKGFKPLVVRGGDTSALKWTISGSLGTHLDDIPPIKAFVIDQAKALNVDSVLLVRFQIYREYGDWGREKILADGISPLMFRGSGDGHWMDREGRHLGFTSLRDVENYKRVDGSKVRILSSQEWIDLMATLIVKDIR
jgi:hypothetical protein